MKQQPKKALFIILGLLLFISLACRSSAQADPTATPEIVEEPEPVVEVIAHEPEPTNTTEPILPPTEEEPVEEPIEEPSVTMAEEFFIEEFNSDPVWYFEVVQGPGNSDPSKLTYNFDFGRMIFDIPERHLYAYYLYEEVNYENVRLDINFENRGVNSQQIGLICQMSDEGWYELGVQSDGIWELYAVQDGYNRIASGGSKYVKTGKEVNEYTMICEGNKISFFINGVEPTGSPYIDRKYALRRGTVGFSVSSLQSIPVKVEVDWFAVSQP